MPSDFDDAVNTSWLEALDMVRSFGAARRAVRGGAVGEVKVHVRCRRSGFRFASGVGQQVVLMFLPLCLSLSVRV